MSKYHSSVHSIYFTLHACACIKNYVIKATVSGVCGLPVKAAYASLCEEGVCSPQAQPGGPCRACARCSARLLALGCWLGL